MNVTTQTRRCGIALLILLLGPGWAEAQRFTNTPVRATLTVADKENIVMLAGRTDTDLFYSPPNMPAGVYASIPLAGVQLARLDFTVDEAALNKAIYARRWREAALLVLRGLEPTLPYLDLPGNEAIEAASAACGYLMNAAALSRYAGGREGTNQAHQLLARVVLLSDRIQKAGWYRGAEAARLRAAQALISLGRLDDAAKRMEDAAIPEPGEANFGLFWLVKATLAEARGRSDDAIDAAARALAFDNKNTETFGPALLLYARTCEKSEDWPRARDVYYEIARLFRGTDAGDLARARLAFIMKEGLTVNREQANVTKLFMGSEEDMDALARAWLDELAKQEEKKP